MSSIGGELAPGREDAAAIARNTSVGVRLLISAVGFVFMAFLFAFFYLKAVNANADWRPPHTNPTQAWGIVPLACVLLATLTFELGRRALRSPDAAAWRVALGLALSLSIAATVVMVLEILNAHFSAYDGGGYSSVFYGWLATLIVFWLGAVYWVETLLVTGLRRLPNPEVPDGDPVELLWPSADACVVYLYLMAGVTIAFYVLLYLVK